MAWNGLKATIFLLLLILCFSINRAQRAADDEEQLEMERHGARHEHEEGSGNSFNPDDEDDLSVSCQSGKEEILPHKIS